MTLSVAPNCIFAGITSNEGCLSWNPDSEVLAFASDKNVCLMASDDQVDSASSFCHELSTCLCDSFRDSRMKSVVRSKVTKNGFRVSSGPDLWIQTNQEVRGGRNSGILFIVLSLWQPCFPEMPLVLFSCGRSSLILPSQHLRLPRNCISSTGE